MTPSGDPRLLVHAYVDGELDPAHALEVERQLAADPSLAAERERIEALRRAIAQQLPRESAPPGLARRVEAALGLRPARTASHPSWTRAASHPSWRALAASVAVAAFLGSGATWLVLSPGPGDADMIVGNHLRALMAPQPVDVGSSAFPRHHASSISPARAFPWSAAASTSSDALRCRRSFIAIAST
jgi:anti-sigma factor RsiW